jgi:hypothetical protein
MAGIKNPRGNPTPGWGPGLGPIARHAPGLSIELLLFSRRRPGPGCSFLEPSMERDRGAQRINSFNHCCYARARGMARKKREPNSETKACCLPRCRNLKRGSHNRTLFLLSSLLHRPSSTRDFRVGSPYDLGHFIRTTNARAQGKTC